MDSVEKARLKYFRNILDTKNNICSNLIRLVLCFPKMEYLLVNNFMQLKNIKYIFRKYNNI